MLKHAISGELTIYTAAAEKAALHALLDRDSELELNLAQINEMDSAGLQILIALKTEAAKKSKKLSYVMHSKAVLDILEMTNMTIAFGDQIILT
ncbi:MAG: STAS domain-containing protein [Burkholderiaceae bacterium]|nr:STAS domain-containing protein [Burkholderiaceae bacterium]